MSYDVGTLDGNTFNGGFWGPDTSRIMLGDLPTMIIGQFSLFAAEVICQLPSELSGEDRSKADELISFARTRLEGTPVGTVPTPCSEADGNDQGAALAAEGMTLAVGSDLNDASTYYSDNPFVIREGSLVIGDIYEVEPLEFMHFALHNLRGGMAGWDQTLGVPASVVNAMEQIDEAFATS